MIEFFITLAVIILSFIWIYREMPRETAGHFKMLFFTMALFTMVVMVFSLFTIDDVTTISVYDVNDTYLGKEVHQTVASSAIKSTALTITQILFYMIALVLFIILMLWVYATYKDMIKKRRDKTDIFAEQI